MESLPLLDARIKLTSEEAKFAQKLLNQWRDQRLLSPGAYAQLLESIQEVSHHAFDWHRLAKYTLRMAVLFLIIAVISLIFDSIFLKFIRKVLEINPYVRAAITMTIAVGTHHYAWRRSERLPEELWMNEAIHAAGAIVLSLAALQLAEAVGGLDLYGNWRGAMRGKLVMLLLGFTYAFIGYATISNLIWSCGMFTIGVWAAHWAAPR